MGDKMTAYEISWIAAVQGAAYNDKLINEEEYKKLIERKRLLEESIINMTGEEKEDTQNKINDIIKAIALKDANREAFNAARDAIIESTEEILSPPTVFIMAVKDTRKRVSELVDFLKNISDDLETTNNQFYEYGQLIDNKPNMYDRSAGKDNRKQWQYFNTRREWFAERFEEAKAVLAALNTRIPTDMTSDKIKSIIMNSYQYDEYDAILNTRTNNARSENELRTRWYAEDRECDMQLHDCTFCGLLTNINWKREIERLIKRDSEIVDILSDIYNYAM
jgi:hypothetical protein